MEKKTHILCPRCELNYLNSREKYCDVCKAELGIGEKALKQFADTAVGLVTDIVNPIGDYLEKYENIFDQRVYNAEIQSYAKQMFFASQAMRQEAAENTTGQNFVYDM